MNKLILNRKYGFDTFRLHKKTKDVTLYFFNLDREQCEHIDTKDFIDFEYEGYNFLGMIISSHSTLMWPTYREIRCDVEMKLARIMH